MKKFYLLFLVLALAVAVTLPTVAVAEQSTDYTQTEVYRFVEDFVTRFPDRTAGVIDQLPTNGVQYYLRDLFKGVVGANGDVILHEFNLQTEFTKGYNVVATLKKQGATKQIIIGAHYDSVGPGASDNATGVAALYFTMQKLAQNVDKLPCNVTFIAFDGEELGLYGSYAYSQDFANQLDNTLVMFNVDSISNGDNLYLFCENKTTDLQQLVLGHSSNTKVKPYAKGTFGLDINGIGYYEMPQNSDQTPFRLQGVPTAFFFSGTYSAQVWNYAESVDPSKAVMNGSDDTFQNLVANNGGQFVQRVNDVTDAICNTLWDANFMQVASDARSQLVNYDLWYNPLWPMLILAGVTILLVLFALSYYRKLQKRGIMGTAEVKTAKVFSTPDAEDIFTFKN